MQQTEKKRLTTRNQILDLLDSVKFNGLKPREIVRSLNAEDRAGSVRTMIYQLHKDGRVRRVSGKYYANPIRMQSSPAAQLTTPPVQIVAAPKPTVSDEALKQEILELRAIVKYLESKLTK